MRVRRKIERAKGSNRELLRIFEVKLVRRISVKHAFMRDEDERNSKLPN